MTQVDHTRMANAIRGLAMDAVEKAKSGHPGLPMGAADVATVLFTQFLKFDAADPYWPDRDRFVLSAGHGSMLLYALLYLTGSKDMTLDQLRQTRKAEIPFVSQTITPTLGFQLRLEPFAEQVNYKIPAAVRVKINVAAEIGPVISRLYDSNGTLRGLEGRTYGIHVMQRVGDALLLDRKDRV